VEKMPGEAMTKALDTLGTDKVLGIVLNDCARSDCREFRHDPTLSSRV
jgi:hypothetical protein